MTCLTLVMLKYICQLTDYVFTEDFDTTIHTPAPTQKMFVLLFSYCLNIFIYLKQITGFDHVSLFETPSSFTEYIPTISFVSMICYLKRDSVSAVNLPTPMLLSIILSLNVRASYKFFVQVLYLCL